MQAQSADPVANEYQAKVQVDTASLTALADKDKGEVAVKVVSVVLINETAQVRFTTEKLNAAGENPDNSPVQKWSATIAYQFGPQLRMTEQQRLVNPLGFKAYASLNAAKHESVLGAPASRSKSKTNVGKLGIPGAVVAGFLVLMAGMLQYQRHQKRAAGREEPKSQLAQPTFLTNNTALGNDSIEHIKTELKKKEQADHARVRSLEEAQARAEKAAADAATKATQTEQPPAPGATVAVDRKAPPPPPTPMERKLVGSVMFTSAGGILPSRCRCV
jgi:hypothetical protein